MARVRKTIIGWKDPLVFATILSLSVHALLFSAWKLNQRFNWLSPKNLPTWLQKLSTPPAKQLARDASNRSRQIPLVFVDVDPQSSVDKAPENTRFYGAANSEAAAPQKRNESPLPNIEGKQNEILKTTPDSPTQAQPLQPSPSPQPAPAKEKEVLPPPEQTAPGDLALARPRENNAVTPQPSEAAEEAEKRRNRPRTLDQARRNLQGERMNQIGGANRIALEPSFDVKVTSFGDYDRQFIAAVQNCWYELLEGRNTVPGKIVVEFQLNYDGRITDMKVVENTTKDLLLELICKGAIEKPSPYRKWPTEMRREMQSDSREVRFTFYYQ